MAEFKVFDFRSVDSAGLEISDFITNGLFMFCSYFCDYYPDLVCEFYANVYVDEIDEEFDDSVLKSKVNRVKVYVNEDLLEKFFSLVNERRECIGEEVKKNAQVEIMQNHHDYILQKLIEKCKAQEDLEIVTKVLDPNGLGAIRCIFHWALTKCVKPKVHS